VDQAEQDPFPPQGVDLERPSVARVYDWFLGGTANWAIDRAFGERVLDSFPMARQIAIANRLFLHRAVRHLVSLGVRQFVDIGAGVPTMGNTHQVADDAAADSRVVYVDHEPVAVAHSRVLLEKHGDPARHAAVNADLRNPDRLWQQAIQTGVLDLDEPVALLLIAVLHVQQPDADGTDIGPQAVARCRELLPPGSYLAISHVSDEGAPPVVKRKLDDAKRMYDAASSPVVWRTYEQLRALFGDFELVDPGLVWTPDWHPEDSSPSTPQIEFETSAEAAIRCGVGRKR
jgi:O-methyltransferase involved in polyketide biosynthesis